MPLRPSPSPRRDTTVLFAALLAACGPSDAQPEPVEAQAIAGDEVSAPPDPTVAVVLEVPADLPVDGLVPWLAGEIDRLEIPGRECFVVWGTLAPGSEGGTLVRLRADAIGHDIEAGVFCAGEGATGHYEPDVTPTGMALVAWREGGFVLSHPSDTSAHTRIPEPTEAYLTTAAERPIVGMLGEQRADPGLATEALSLLRRYVGSLFAYIMIPVR